MSDNKEEYPETGAGGGGSTPATDPGTENAVGDDMPTTPHMGDASDGGEFSSPSPLHNEDEGDEGNTGQARSPSERGPEENPSRECIELSTPHHNEPHDMNGLSRCPNRPQIRPRPACEADSDGQNPDTSRSNGSNPRSQTCLRYPRPPTSSGVR